MSEQPNGSIRSTKDYEDNPQGHQALWEVEIEAAIKAKRKFKNNGDKIYRRFLDMRSATGEDDLTRNYRSKLNLFTANVQTQRALMYGAVPKADVSRAWDDANDDEARVASEVLERLINADPGGEFAASIGTALDDRLLPGLGQCRARYEADFQETEVPAQVGVDPTTGQPFELAPAYVDERKVGERCVTDYVHWHDFIWSPCRTWSECRWVGFRAYMTRDELIKRFGEKIGKKVELKRSKLESGEMKEVNGNDAFEHDPWMRAEVWEIWDKTKGMVYWVSLGNKTTLDEKEDPYQLRGFFPCPEPMAANLTTQNYMPRADYNLFQDLYNEIDIITTRMYWLERALKVTGTYDAEQEAIGGMLTGGGENQLIPVQNWQNFAEKGGAAGAVDYFPVEQVAKVLEILRGHRENCIQLLYQTTGMADIFRGASDPRETLGAQKLKTQFAGARMDSVGVSFSNFATQIQRIRCELISNFYDDETIAAESNVQFMFDAQNPGVIQGALKLIRSKQAPDRILIQPETLASENKSDAIAERGEFLQGLSTFLSSAAPLVQTMPQAMPMLLEMLKWTMSPFKGSQEVEGLLDQAIEQLKAQPPQQEQDDGGAAKEQAKAQASLQAVQMKEQGATQRHMATLQSRQGEVQFQAQQKQQEKVIDLQAKQQENQQQAELAQASQARDHAHDVEMADINANASGQEELLRQRAALESALAEINAEFENTLILSEQDHNQDMEKIELDGEVKSRYSPGEDSISGKGRGS